MFKRLRKLLIISLLLFILVSVVFVYLGYKQYEGYINEVPLEQKINEIRNQENYTYLDDINPLLVKATYIIEDKRFFDRNTVLDYRSLGRAIWVNLTSFSLSEGGSTIPQQLSKNFYITFNHSPQDKIAEYFVTKDLLANYTKEEILELYLNVIYYGDGYYGVYEASTGYFNLLPSELNDNEATLLVGLPQSPANYQLSNDNIKTYERQKQILNKLFENDIISSEEIDTILTQDLRRDN